MQEVDSLDTKIFRVQEKLWKYFGYTRQIFRKRISLQASGQYPYLKTDNFLLWFSYKFARQSYPLVDSSEINSLVFTYVSANMVYCGLLKAYS